MKYATVILAALMFVAVGAAQPVNDSGPEMAENMTNQSEVADPGQPESPSENRTGAQFDARLQTAITTLEALTEIAPSDEAEKGIEEALSTLREVQNSTYTASLGDRDRDRDMDRDRNQTGENRSDSGQQGPSEDAGPGGDKGPSENGNRPGFVQGLIGGIFG